MFFYWGRDVSPLKKTLNSNTHCLNYSYCVKSKRQALSRLKKNSQPGWLETARMNPRESFIYSEERQHSRRHVRVFRWNYMKLYPFYTVAWFYLSIHPPNFYLLMYSFIRVRPKKKIPWFNTTSHLKTFTYWNDLLAFCLVIIEEKHYGFELKPPLVAKRVFRKSWKISN